jgi:hypothetical protein
VRISIARSDAILSTAGLARLGEIDVGKLEASIVSLPAEVRFNLGGALDKPMCPATFGNGARGRTHRGDIGGEEEEEEKGDGLVGSTSESEAAGGGHIGAGVAAHVQGQGGGSKVMLLPRKT